MSFHHTNITWQSPDGTWSCGFFERIPGNTMDEDYDAEWDDDFDMIRFQFVSTGHADEESAFDAWGGPNPGSTTTIPYDASSTEEIEQYEDMAARKYEEESPRPRPSGILGLGGSTLGYYGPPKPRTLKAIKAERDTIVERQASESLGGYLHNLRDSDALAGLEPRIERELAKANQAQRETFEDQDQAHRRRLRSIADDAAEANRRSLRGRRYHLAKVSAVREQADAADASAKKRIKAAKKSTKSSPGTSSTAAPPQQNTVPMTGPNPGVCGKTTSSGTPCRNTSNCPVHR